MTRWRHTLALLIVAACDDDLLETEDDASISKLGDPDAAVCRSQCGPGTSDCDRPPLEQFPGEDEQLRSYQSQCRDAGNYPFVVRGSCSEGGRFLHIGYGKGSERTFFTADGKFVSMEKGSDFSTPPCEGRTYFPEPPVCGQPTVQEVICGRSPWPVGTAH